MPFGWVFEKISKYRNASYDNGKRTVHDLGAYTISVGNITTGGTGKTPLVILVSEILAARGKRVCVLTRGYGRKNPKKRVLVSDSKSLRSDPANAGDEPQEIAKKLLGRAVVVADADRIAAADYAKESFGANAFVLDDAFQHRKVKRDVDIVCIDALNPWGGGKTLPFGRLREPVANLQRAHIIVITRADLAGNIDEIRSEISKHARKARIFTATSKMAEMTLLQSFLSTPIAPLSDELGLQDLAHSKVFAFCGIGNPESFFAQLRRDNFEIAGTRSFSDHHKYKSKEIESVVKEAKKAGAGYLLTTPKDAVKLGGISPGLPCFVIQSKMVIDDYEQFAVAI